ncbi:hypothetical protein [Streptomyces coriariae]|uniref:hypothetical protein n=1 Tax=Streptomyces coriariae TaxID=2864460 RepID=UPI001E531F06|nr:hypothetical protein [Streptomyces coriariae]
MVAAVPALLLGGLFALDSCGAGKADELSSAQVDGVWKGSGGGRVEFDDDGRFEMSGIPRNAIEFGFIDPPPGNGRLSGRGEWSLVGDDDRSSTIELRFDAAGSFSDDSESTLLQVEEAGDRPKLYFDTDADEGYGYEVRREAASTPAGH